MNRAKGILFLVLILTSTRAGAAPPPHWSDYAPGSAASMMPGRGVPAGRSGGGQQPVWEQQIPTIGNFPGDGLGPRIEAYPRSQPFPTAAPKVGDNQRWGIPEPWYHLQPAQVPGAQAPAKKLYQLGDDPWRGQPGPVVVVNQPLANLLDYHPVPIAPMKPAESPPAAAIAPLLGILALVFHVVAGGLGSRRARPDVSPAARTASARWYFWGSPRTHER
jgi:hypothetical protein